VRYCLVSLSILAVALVVSAQVTRIEKVPIGKVTFYRGAVAMTLEIPHGESGSKTLTVTVQSSSNEYEIGIISLTSEEVATVLRNLQQMLDESASTADELTYQLTEKNFLVGINGGSKPHFAVMADGATAATVGEKPSYNRETLKKFVTLLKQGQTAMTSGPISIPASPGAGLTQPKGVTPKQADSVATAQPTPSGAPVQPPSKPLVQEAMVEFWSSPAGADIEVDGKYIGSTPSTVTVQAGEHTITMRKWDFGTWQKTMKVTSGNLRVAAYMQQVGVTLH
jgi:PEGA domain